MLSRFVAAQIVSLAAALPISPAVSHGMTLPHSDPPFSPVVIVDLTPSDNENPVATRVFSFTDENDDPTLAQMVAMVRSSRGPASASAALRFLRQHGRQLSIYTSNRWVSHQGDSVDVFIFHPENQVPVVTFEEEARQSRLSANLDSLIETAGSITSIEGEKAKGNVAMTRRKYRLRNTRAVLRIRAQAATAKDQDEDKSEGPPVMTSIVTGPSERVFLSLNGAYSKVRQTHYSPSDQTFEHGIKPTELLLGVNYSMQDVFENESASGIRAFLQGVYVGFLAEPSRKPFNQIATVVGFRHSPPPFESLFSLETVSPYIGLVWARNDVPASTEGGVKTRYGRRALIMGFALGLDRALGWLEGTQ